MLNGTAEQVADYAASEACAKVRQATAAGAYGKELAGMTKNILDVSVPAPKLKDLYTTLTTGSMQCISADAKANGQRNTHVISFHPFFRTGTNKLAYMVHSCSDCNDWDTDGTCRHAKIVTALLNHPVIAHEVAASSEIIRAQMCDGSVCPCGATRHSVFIYVTGRGYLIYHLCLADGDGSRECKKGILI